jgi:hypothetical protein
MFATAEERAKAQAVLDKATANASNVNSKQLRSLQLGNNSQLSSPTKSPSSIIRPNNDVTADRKKS